MTQKIENNKVIVLEQKPIISYDLVEQKGKEVANKIASLNLEGIEPNEDNLKLLKTTRTELKKEFDVFENQRKMVKELVMKPYNDFDEAYKVHISSLFKDADLQLKNKVGVVDDEILSLKIDGIKEYFIQGNKHDFIVFEDLQLKIIKSITDKKLKDQIDEYLVTVENNLTMINTLENKDRILVKYQMHKDLNRAISEAQVEVKREAEIKAQNEAKEKARLEFEEKERLRQESAKAQEEINAEIEEHETRQDGQNNEGDLVDNSSQAPKKYKVKFSVTATMEEITDLKKYMNEKGINYE